MTASEPRFDDFRAALDQTGYDYCGAYARNCFEEAVEAKERLVERFGLRTTFTTRKNSQRVINSLPEELYYLATSVKEIAACSESELVDNRKADGQKPSKIFLKWARKNCTGVIPLIDKQIQQLFSELAAARDREWVISFDPSDMVYGANSPHYSTSCYRESGDYSGSTFQLIGSDMTGVMYTIDHTISKQSGYPVPLGRAWVFADESGYAIGRKFGTVPDLAVKTASELLQSCYSSGPWWAGETDRTGFRIDNTAQTWTLDKPVSVMQRGHNRPLVVDLGEYISPCFGKTVASEYTKQASWECPHCGCEYSDSDGLYLDSDGDPVGCRECSTRCEECGEIITFDDSRTTPDGYTILCQECYDEQYIYCDSTDDTELRSECRYVRIHGTTFVVHEDNIDDVD